jgi:hypothetical protein
VSIGRAPFVPLKVLLVLAAAVALMVATADRTDTAQVDRDYRCYLYVVDTRPDLDTQGRLDFCADLAKNDPENYEFNFGEGGTK